MERLTSNKTADRDREICRLVKSLTIQELAERYNLQEGYIRRIVAHGRRWGTFA